ncbi:hypothetical protein N7497_000882 [Penicillium chrysogenum]|nr:hypothetical protein N7497_000882 [Penicillium chrysogenum]
MDSNQRQPSRSLTLWSDGTPHWAALERTSRPSASSSRPQPCPVIIPSTLTLPHPALQKGQIEVLTIQPVFENPWLAYEATVKRQRDTRQYPSFEAEILIRQAIAGNNQPNITPQLSRSGGVLLSEEQLFLVREPVELSISHILASRCTITGGEIAAIVRPVLGGIQYPRGHGRALAALSADTILLTELGEVRIAGVEHSCQINAAGMDAATMKLFALAEVVERLILKNPSQYPWTAGLKDLPEELKNAIHRKSCYAKLFDQLGDEGKLKMLVNAANKTAYHNLESYKRI